MSNAAAHRLGAALVVGSLSAYSEHTRGQSTIKPLLHASVAAACGTLPDILEPAFHPNHRQFFHSFGFAGLLGWGLCNLYRFEPKTQHEKFACTTGLIAGGAYLVHLAMDATTRKSLPVI